MVLKADMFFLSEGEGYSSDENGTQALSVGEILSQIFIRIRPSL